jgi:hypothetical protein
VSDQAGHLEQVEWTWPVAAPDRARVDVFWPSGPVPLERVDVEESPDEVRIGLFERYPPPLDEDGTPIAIAAVRVIRAVRVELATPLGDRRLVDSIDGHTPPKGRRPEAVKPCREAADRVAAKRLPVPPAPSGEPVDWRSGSRPSRTEPERQPDTEPLHIRLFDPS